MKGTKTLGNVKNYAAVALLMLSFSTPSLAGLMTFDFTYEFRGGFELSGNLTGEVQPDMDTILATDYAAVFTGHTFPAVMAADAPGGSASFSGDTLALSGSGLFFGFPDSGGFFEISETSVSVFTIGFGVLVDVISESFAAERWSIEPTGPVAMVPTPNTLLLFGLVVLAIGVSRRQSQTGRR